MTRNCLQRLWSAALLAAVLGLPLYVGCSPAAEEQKSPEQIEESRIKHQETSRREWEG